MKKRTANTLTALAAALIMLSGCGGNAAPAQGSNNAIESPAVTEPNGTESSELDILEANELVTALNTIDKIGACAIAYDMENRYEDKNGNIYYMVTNPQFPDTNALNEYMNTYLTQDFIMQRYFNIFDGETPMCIDVDGCLYINYSPKGGGFSLLPDAPEIRKNSDGSYSVIAAYDNYGAEDKMELKVIDDEGRYKIDDVVFSIAQK
ncbi:MAG: hypothetical protein IJL89_08740 [Firmicutes bacterium]|nr:hypothetical protein [Bacillota bacterium]